MIYQIKSGSMKSYVFFLSCLLFFSCQSKDSKQATNETSQPAPGQDIAKPGTVQPETFCYRLAVGDDPNRQDVWFAKLTVDGHKVSGIYNWIPYEKDNERGLFLGVMDGGIVTGVWNSTIEGNYQKKEVVFKMSDTELVRKRGATEEKDGILRLKESEVTIWAEVMVRVDCEG